MSDPDATCADRSPLPAIGEALESVVTAIDGAVPAVDSPATDAYPDRARSMPWLGVLFAGASLVLLPWVVYLGASLPDRQLSEHYALAWAGFDVFLFVALAATSYAVLRRSPWVGMSAGATAAFLVTDAWFDVITSSGRAATIEAALMAVVVEIPLAVICVWLCGHADRLADRRLRILLGRTQRPADHTAGPSADRVDTRP